MYRGITEFLRGQGALPAIQPGHPGRKASCGPPWTNFAPFELSADYLDLLPPAYAGWLKRREKIRELALKQSTDNAGDEG